MRTAIRVLVTAVLLALLAPAAPASAATSPYLVQLADGFKPQEVLNKIGAAATFVYGTVFTGFAAQLTDHQVTALRTMPGFGAIEPDATVTVSYQSGSPRAVGSWGLDRINQRNLPLDGTYSPAHDGSGVTAYIIDTGIQTNHPEFGGRATVGYDAINDGRNGQDCNGHGTHVAGTVGSTTYGVAKKVNLVAVRVLGCNGSGSWSGIVAGLDWVGANARKPAVANLSLGGTPPSNAVNSAADNLTGKNVFVSVAGGNDTKDACNYSPAGAAKVFTIGATARDDTYATYSNYGKCIELLAPGTDITSTWIGSTTKTISGTSMATPHVTGVAALYKQALGDDSQATISTWLQNKATPSKITKIPSNTPNLLLFTAGL